ncbi:GNAT family N-acetyltransferase [Polaromonas aquatica]|uniref:GNAT family N-acetyltransferase n=1 Tax=Polaromonas aquatica TaxID=332657 RepID=UPI003D64E60E
MNFTVELLTEDTEPEYEAFIASIPTALIYASLRYRNLLRDFLGGADDRYLIARNSAAQIVGVLPAFVKSIPGKVGVANSMPFYGSHGGPIIREGNAQVGQLLLKYFNDLAVQMGCGSSTIIFSPLTAKHDVKEWGANVKVTDSRIGQMTRLPENSDEPRSAVMTFLQPKTRNMVRKAEKLGVTVAHSETVAAMQFLSDTHASNMLELGGLAKPKLFFELLTKHFRYGSDYRIYTATIEGAPIAGLLLFYFNRTVDYFTPVIVKEHRSTQALSMLISHAMADAVAEGMTWWNWGGTWHSQSGVYKFKQSWGAIDMPYHYSTTIMDKSLLEQSKEDLIRDYPYFYVAPFAWLKA